MKKRNEIVHQFHFTGEHTVIFSGDLVSNTAPETLQGPGPCRTNVNFIKGDRKEA